MPKRDKGANQVRLGIILKTNEGGLWVVPQVEEVLRRNIPVLVIIPEGGGRLTRALASIETSLHELTLVEVPFDFKFLPRLRTLRSILGIRRVLLQFNVNTVFYHLYASALVGRLTTIGIRGVRRVHMVAGPLYLENRFIRNLERLLLHFDWRIIAGSAYTRRLYLQIGAGETRTKSVAYGVDLDKFSPTRVSPREEFRKRVNIGENKFVVVMVAYVYAPKSMVFPGVGIKGHELILDMWPDFVYRHSQARLIFVGSGFGAEGEIHRRKLIEQSRRSGVEDSVTWIDTIEDVRDIYALADLSVSPSLSENHGAALEASAMTVPSIVSDAGALPETVTAESGWVFHSGNREELRQCLDEAYALWQSGDLKARGMRAREHMEKHFALSDCTSRVVDIIERGE